jgi:phosphotransacetylase
VLLGDPIEIEAAAKKQDLDLPENLEILDPALIRPKYAEALFEARKHKGLSVEMAASQLEDNVVLGTMMLALSEVDGLVSGSGADVEKVRAAAKLAHTKRPDLLIDGPLQYDAAFMPDVAKSKAPNSPVAGRATVFIFSDLNTGNTTYKAVQRSANLISIGPMLQGLKRPVNDLSRGALVDDIVYTIALTAVQATQG